MSGTWIKVTNATCPGYPHPFGEENWRPYDDETHEHWAEDGTLFIGDSEPMIMITGEWQALEKKPEVAPHAYAIEIKVNPGMPRERWTIDDAENIRESLEEARYLRRQLEELGFPHEDTR
jgi:hypothetical protein